MSNIVVRKVKSLGTHTRKALQKLLGRPLKDDESISVMAMPKGAAAAQDKELLAWTKSFIKKYKPALKALADK